MRRWFWILGGVLILVGVAGIAWVSSVQGSPWRVAQMGGPGGGMMGPRMGPGMGPGMMGGWSAQWYGKKFTSNGEQIYYTGVSAKTGPISGEGGPPWMRMGPLGCVACHGVQGRGGVPVMMGTAIPADIRYEALINGEYEHGKKETPYTDALIKRGITEGLDPEGKPLDWTMPRWQMGDADLNDLLAYLKTLH
ncbi:MAG: c-type cytochrome [Candidatus Methylomirabilales bacterium]